MAPVGVLVAGARDILGPGFAPEVFHVDQREFGIALGDVAVEADGEIGGCRSGLAVAVIDEEACHGLGRGGPTGALGGSEFFGEDSEPDAVVDVLTGEVECEGRQVVGVEARSAVGGNGAEGAGLALLRGVDAELADVERADAVLLHRAVDGIGHGAKVLADQAALGAVRLDAEDREQLVGLVADIHAVLRLHARGDHEQAVEAHDMVEAEEVRVLQVVAQRRDEVGVALLACGLGVHGREAPVLAAGEDGIGRGPDGGAGDEQFGALPDVVPAGVCAHGQIEVELPGAFGHLGAESAELFVHGELRVEVVALVFRAEVALAEVALTHALGPVLPGRVLQFPDGAEAGVVADLRRVAEERLVLRALVCARCEKGLCEQLDGAALVRRHGPVVDQPGLAQRGGLLAVLGAGQQGLGLIAGLEAGGALGIEQQLIPEQAGDGSVRAGVEHLALEEGREQREGGDQVGPVVRAPRGEIAQVGEVADALVA